MSKNSNDYNRREFLTNAAFGIAGAGFVGVSGKRLLKPIKQEKIIHKTLGRTGISIPVVSMGVMLADNPEVVKRSYEIGVRFFDTALSYQGGNNEKMVGDVFTALGKREDVFIQTKIPFPGGRRRRGGGGTPQYQTPESRRDKFIEDFEGCLERLKTNYVDVLLIHSPSVEQMNDSGVKEALTKLKNEKKTHHIGVSTHSNMADVLNESARSGFYDVVLTSINFTMADDTELLDAIKNAATNGVGIVAMKTQATRGRQKVEGGVNHTAALKWVMNNEYIHTAIPGYTNFDQMNENFSVVTDLNYTDEEEKYLEDHDVKTALGFCRGCDNCSSTCPKNVDIPTLMRTHMYASCYSDFRLARQTFEEVPAANSIDQCGSCSTCTAGCVNHVNIAENIEELKLMYL
ncbi:MAG: oxidoreductase [bacterium]|nr:oxidoreductase [bacterium]